MKRENSYSLIFTNVPLVILMGVFLFIPFSRIITLNLVGGFFLFSLLYSFRLRFQNLSGFSFNKHNIVILLPVLLFLALLAGYLYSENNNEAISKITTNLGLIAFPVSIFFYRDKIIEKKDPLLIIFVVGVIITGILCYIHAFSASLSYEENRLVFDPDPDWSRGKLSSFKLLTMGFSKFSYDQFSIFLHPSYFTAFNLFSFCIVLHLNEKYQTKRKILPQILFFAVLAYILFTIFLLQSRAGIIVSGIVIIIYVVKYILKWNNKIFIALTILLFLTGFAFIIFNSRIITKIRTLNAIEKKEINNKKMPSRYVIWKYATKELDNNIIFGFGTGDLEDELDNVYKEINFKKGQANHLNMHNQYLETYYRLGLVGLLILIALIIYPFIFYKKFSFLFLVFILIIALNFLAESMLNRQIGVFFFSLFYSFFAICGYEKPSIKHIPEKPHHPVP